MKKTMIAMSIAAAYGLLGRPPHMIPMTSVKVCARAVKSEGWDD